MDKDTRANRYLPEIRERAVRMVLANEGGHADRAAAIRAIAPKIGCSRESLRRWVIGAEVDDGTPDGMTREERDRIKALELTCSPRLVRKRLTAPLVLGRRSPAPLPHAAALLRRLPSGRTARNASAKTRSATNARRAGKHRRSCTTSSRASASVVRYGRIPGSHSVIRRRRRPSASTRYGSLSPPQRAPRTARAVPRRPARHRPPGRRHPRAAERANRSPARRRPPAVAGRRPER